MKIRRIFLLDQVLSVLQRLLGGALLIGFVGPAVWMALWGNLAWLEVEHAVFSPRQTPAVWGRLDATIAHASELDTRQARLASMRVWLRGRRPVAMNALRLQFVHAALAQIEAGSMADIETLASSTDDVEIRLALARYYQHTGDFSRRDAMLAQVRQYQPRQGDLQNDCEVGGWKLVGYDWQPATIESFPLGRLMLFWQTARQSIGPVSLEAGNGVYTFDNRQIEIFETRNLLPYGDMEYPPGNPEALLANTWKLYPTDQMHAVYPVGLYPIVPDNDTVLRIDSQQEESTLLMHPVNLASQQRYFMIGRANLSGAGALLVMENVNGQNQYPVRFLQPAENRWRSVACEFQVSPSDYWPAVYLGLTGATRAVAQYDDLGIFQLVP